MRKGGRGKGKEEGGREMKRGKERGMGKEKGRGKGEGGDRRQIQPNNNNIMILAQIIQYGIITIALKLTTSVLSM